VATHDFTREDLNPIWRSEYEAEHQELWFQAVALNTNLFLLGRVTGFPFNLLGINPNPFWMMIFRALYESTVMTLCRISLDARREALTVQKFRDDVIANLRSEELRRTFAEHLASLKFDAQLAVVGEEAKGLRDKHLAHLNRELARDPEKRGGYPLLPVTALQMACKGVCTLVDALSLDVGLGFDFIEYNADVIHPVGTDSRPDIDRILDDLARESVVLKMPEEQPRSWSDVWSRRLSAEDKAILNQYRAKFGRPPV
jgi:hypothetical protein